MNKKNGMFVFIIIEVLFLILLIFGILNMPTSKSNSVVTNDNSNSRHNLIDYDNINKPVENNIYEQEQKQEIENLMELLNGYVDEIANNSI